MAPKVAQNAAKIKQLQTTLTTHDTLNKIDRIHHLCLSIDESLSKLTSDFKTNSENVISTLQNIRNNSNVLSTSSLSNQRVSVDKTPHYVANKTNHFRFFCVHVSTCFNNHNPFFFNITLTFFSFFFLCLLLVEP